MLKNPPHRNAKPFLSALFPALLAAWWFASHAAAAALPPSARGEIDSPLSRLAASGCQFERNSNWHTADEAQAHLAGSSNTWRARAPSPAPSSSSSVPRPEAA